MKNESKNNRTGAGMTRADWNFTIDVLTFLVILAMIITGFIIRYTLPPGTGGREGGQALVLLGMNRHDWGGLHFWLAIAAIFLFIVHVALHWSWICGVVRRWTRAKARSGTRLSKRSLNAAGVGFLLFTAVVVAGSFMGSLSAVEIRPGISRRVTHGATVGAPASHDVHPHTTCGTGHEIRGHMTLEQVARTTGVSLHEIKTALGLPEETSKNERLGRLKREYGFQIEDVRQATGGAHVQDNRNFNRKH